MKKIAIIGAGVAGLSAASYLRRNGYDTEIFESRDRPGGLCTAWKKGGYTFDGCIHWLVGSGPAHPLYLSWNELLDMRSLAFVEMDDFARIDDERGGSLTLYSDADRLGAELRRHAGAKTDPAAIDAMVDGIKLFHREEDDPGIKKRKRAFLSAWGRVSTVEFAQKLESPFLEFALPALFGPGSIIGLAWLMSVFHLKSAGYPIGGSLEFVRAIEKRYLALGGKVRYRSRVEKVLVEHGKARGVLLENGETVEADIVVSAADGRHTVFSLLDGKYLNDAIRGFYAAANPTLAPSPSWVQVSLGLSRSFAGEPHQLMWKARRPLAVDERSRHEVIGVRIYNFDPGLAPAGHTVVIGMFNTPHGLHWHDLREKSREQYEGEKNRIAEEYIALLDDKLGNIKDRVEVVDVATPATAIRYTNNWQGSYLGWGWGTRVPVGTQRELPGLKNFFMTGQWITSSGGLPPVLEDGKRTAGLICAREGREFKTGC